MQAWAPAHTSLTRACTRLYTGTRAGASRLRAQTRTDTFQRTLVPQEAGSSGLRWWAGAPVPSGSLLGDQTLHQNPAGRAAEERAGSNPPAPGQSPPGSCTGKYFFPFFPVEMASTSFLYLKNCLFSIVMMASTSSFCFKKPFVSSSLLLSFLYFSFLGV